MTVSTTDSEVVYVSGGPAFPIPYRFLQNADIQAVLVKQDGTSETLTGAQYTLTGAGSQSGGTMTSSYAAGVLATPGASLTISRVMDAVQPTDLRNQGKYLAETHENVFDRLTMLIQQGFSFLRRALLKHIGKDYYDAEGSLIKNVADPVDMQDVSTKKYTQQYVESILATGQGPINNAANIVYVYPDSQARTVQSLSSAIGATGIGYGASTVGAALDLRVERTSNTGAAVMPSGLTASRPSSPSLGMTRFNTESDKIEVYRSTGWGDPVDTLPSSLTYAPDLFINGAPLVKFGNMTSGAGLPGLFDVDIFTSVFVAATTGYAGVTLASPAAIGFVEIISGTTGYDGSGGSNTATLSLYAKNGAAPVSATDGVLLGTTTVPDDNTQKTAVILSTDQTLYAHVWVVISTAVSAVATEVRFFKQAPAAPVIGNGHNVVLSSCDYNVALTHGGREVPQFRIKFFLNAPRVVLMDFHGDVVHVGEGAAASVAVGYSFGIVYRSAETEALLRVAPFSIIKNAVGGGNVSERNPQHYGNKTITTSRVFPAGYHEISVLGSGHTDGSSIPGLIQILSEAGKGVNCLRVVLLP